MSSSIKNRNMLVFRITDHLDQSFNDRPIPFSKNRNFILDLLGQSLREALAARRDSARSAHETARAQPSAATAARAAQEQALAVAKERVSAHRADRAHCADIRLGAGHKKNRPLRACATNFA